MSWKKSWTPLLLWVRPREAKTLAQDHTTCGISRWHQQAGVPGHLIPGIVISSPCPACLYSNQTRIPLSTQKSPLDQCGLNTLTWLLIFAVSQLLLALPSGQNYFREENQARQACALAYCSVGCFSESKEAKWNKSQKEPNCYIIDIRELPRRKEGSSVEQWSFWRVKCMD